jgi:hypothetical protein
MSSVDMNGRIRAAARRGYLTVDTEPPSPEGSYPVPSINASATGPLSPDPNMVGHQPRDLNEHLREIAAGKKLGYLSGWRMP